MERKRARKRANLVNTQTTTRIDIIYFQKVKDVVGANNMSGYALRWTMIIYIHEMAVVP